MFEICRREHSEATPSCRWKALLAAAAFAGAVGLAAGPAWAQVPVELFEMHDGDTDDDVVTAMDPDPNAGGDWVTYPTGITVQGETNPFPIYDDPATQRETTGGTKELDDFPDWVWKFVSKDLGKFDVVHVAAFATEFTWDDPGDGGQTDNIVGAGLDRLVGGGTSGTTQFVFWLLRDSLAFVEGTGGGDKNSIDGNHVTGDIRVGAEVQGNEVVGIEVCVWDGGLVCADDIGGLNITPECDDATVVGSGTTGYYDTIACGKVNQANTQLPWGAGVPDGDITVEAGRFLEFWVNTSAVAAAFQVPESCATSILWGTSSSVVQTSAFKNFGIGGFDQCSIKVAKLCETTQVTQFSPTLKTEIFVQALVENDGGGTLASNSTVTVCDDEGQGLDAAICGTDTDLTSGGVTLSTLPGLCVDGSNAPQVDSGRWVACFNDTTCTDIDATWSCSYDQGDLDGGEIALVEATFEVDGNGVIDNNVEAELVDNVLGVTLVDTSAEEAQEDCEPLTLSAMLDINKTCDVVLVNNGSALEVEVQASGRYCNTGEAPLLVDVENDRNNDSPGNTTDDVLLTDVSGVLLEAGISCSTGAECPDPTGSNVDIECVGAGKRCAVTRNACVNNSDCPVETGNTCEDETGVCLVTGTNSSPGVCVSELDGSGFPCAINDDCQEGETCEGAAVVCGTYDDSYNPLLGETDDEFQPELVGPFADTVEVRAPAIDNPVLQTTNGGSGFDEFATATDSCAICPTETICTEEVCIALHDACVDPS